MLLSRVFFLQLSLHKDLKRSQVHVQPCLELLLHLLVHLCCCSNAVRRVLYLPLPACANALSGAAANKDTELKLSNLIAGSRRHGGEDVLTNRWMT